MPENTIKVEHGKPLIFGSERKKGIRFNNGKPEIVIIGENGITESDLIIHDETNMFLANMYSQMAHPEFPEPIGVLHADPSKPTYNELLQNQLDEAKSKANSKQLDLQALVTGNESWEVK